MSDDPIRVFDAFGREMLVPREEWRAKVLPGSLAKARANPEELYGVVAQAVRDGFAPDVVADAELLARIDPLPVRGATVLGIVYRQLGRLDDAERVLRAFPADGAALTNLAQVLDARGDGAAAQATLWQALELDPNLDAALGWYASLHPADGFARVAALPGSWRAQLWLAREALGRGDAAAAMKLYQESLQRAGAPAPLDLLAQMSGDLGRAGRLSELIELAAPRFDPQLHGLWVGNNLIKAFVDLGRLGEARAVVERLYALQRLDFRQHLEFWDAEIARAGLPKQPPLSPAIQMMVIEGPVWTRGGSPFVALSPAKAADAPRVAFFGSAALLPNAPSAPQVQLSDGPGRLSRALPLLLAEQAHLGSAIHARALIPMAQGAGFALFGGPSPDAHLCQMAGGSAELVALLVDAREEPWKVSFRRLRVEGAALLASGEARVDPRDPWPGVRALAAQVQQVALPAWYGEPDADYLLRLEQDLAVLSESFVPGFRVNGEHEILDGALQMCARLPSSALARLVFAQTVRLWRKTRPALVAEYAERIALLQRQHPIGGGPGELIAKSLSENESSSNWRRETGY